MYTLTLADPTAGIQLLKTSELQTGLKLNSFIAFEELLSLVSDLLRDLEMFSYYNLVAA